MTEKTKGEPGSDDLDSGWEDDAPPAPASVAPPLVPPRPAVSVSPPKPGVPAAKAKSVFDVGPEQPRPASRVPAPPRPAALTAPLGKTLVGGAGAARVPASPVVKSAAPISDAPRIGSPPAVPKPPPAPPRPPVAKPASPAPAVVISPPVIV